MTLIDFRPATVDDYADIAGLISSDEKLFLVYPNGRFPFTVERVVELATQRRELNVATAGREVIGLVNLYDYQTGALAFVGNVVIAREYRGRGLGRRLLMHMIERSFEELALRELRISVFNTNTPALLLYKDLGFCPYAIEQRVDVSGQCVALIHMRLVNAEQADRSADGSTE